MILWTPAWGAAEKQWETYEAFAAQGVRRLNLLRWRGERRGVRLEFCEAFSIARSQSSADFLSSASDAGDEDPTTAAAACSDAWAASDSENLCVVGEW